MRLFLIRHAHALDVEAPRPLSERGKAVTGRVAEFFKANGRLQPDQIWHSPLQRAFETAAELATHLNIDSALVETDGLQPFDDPAVMAERLSTDPPSHDLALVGHQPHLGALATLMVCGRAEPSCFHFRKNAILALRISDSVHPQTEWIRWRVAWHYSPEFLGKY